MDIPARYFQRIACRPLHQSLRKPSGRRVSSLKGAIKMTSAKSLDFVGANPEHDGIIAAHYLAIWESYGIPPDELSDEARQIVLKFLESGRDLSELVSFIAFDGTKPVGSVSCRLNIKNYPIVLRPAHAKEGYVWSVFTEPAYRGRGIARKLVEMAVEHFEKCGCTAVVLHASEAGQRLYGGLGFEPTSEMRLQFRHAVALTPKPLTNCRASKTHFSNN